MTNATSNFQIGQSLHNEYEAKYGQSTQSAQSNTISKQKLNLATVISSLMFVGAIISQL